MHAGGQNFAYDPSNTSILKMQPQSTTRPEKQSSKTPPTSTSPSTSSLQETLHGTLSKTPTSTTTSTTPTLAEEEEGRNGRKDSLDSSASSVTSTLKPNEKEDGGKGEERQGKKSISAFMKKTKEGLKRTFAFPEEEEEGGFKAYPESFRASGRM